MSDVLERIYQNKLGLETAILELTLQAEKQGLAEVGEDAHGRSERTPAALIKA